MRRSDARFRSRRTPNKTGSSTHTSSGTSSWDSGHRRKSTFLKRNGPPARARAQSPPGSGAAATRSSARPIGSICPGIRRTRGIPLCRARRKSRRLNRAQRATGGQGSVPRRKAARLRLRRGFLRHHQRSRRHCASRLRISNGITAAMRCRRSRRMSFADMPARRKARSVRVTTHFVTKSRGSDARP